MRSSTSFRAVALTAAAVGLAAVALPTTAAGAASRASGGGNDLVARAGGHAAFHAARGSAGVFFGAEAGHAAGRPAGISASAAPADAARGWVAHYPGLFRAPGTLTPARTTQARGGDAIVRLQQKVSGLPVVGGEMVVTLDADNNLVSVNGETTSASSADTSPAVSAARAASIARRSLSRGDHGASVTASAPVLSVLDFSLLGGAEAAVAGPTTVWATTVSSRDRVLRHQVFVDATRGFVALDLDQNSHASAVVCRPKNGDDSLVNDPTCSSGASLSPELQVVAGDTTTPPTSASDADVFNAYRFAHAVDHFYSTLLGRNSINGTGGELDSTVHFCDANFPSDCPMQNAFWDGHEMVYGSGYASALDVVGHEMTHGVTEKTSNLFSYYQSGAINESLSDVMGEMIQQIEGPNLTPTAYAGTPWLIGEDLFAGGLRNMSDPTVDSPADPDRMTSSHYNAFHPWDNAFDSGGVHANDGVNNKAAYLMAAGANGNGTAGTFNNVANIKGLSGADQIEKDVKVANIYYRLDNIMSSGTSYADLYNLLPQACTQLVSTASKPQHLPLPGGGTTDITTADCAQVTLAVKATEMNKQPIFSAAKIAPPSPTCTNGGSASKKRLDNFETSNPLASTGTFTRGHGGTDSLGGKSFGQWWWSKSNISDYGPNASVPVFQDQHSKYSLWGDDADPFGAFQQTGQPYDREDSWVQTKSAIPARVGTFVRFDDAWDFDYGPSGNPGDTNVYNYDGGRVEYSVDGGKHWYDTGAPSTVDKRALLVNGGYNGRLSNTDGLFTDPSDPTFHYVDPNPLKGKKGFVGSSHGWTSSRLDLSSLNKKSVLLRWRVASDDQLGSLGWYVDNVYAFSCNPTTATLTAPQSVKKGRTAALKAHVVRSGTTTAVAKVPVQLWSRRHGTSKWVAVGAPRLTNSSGNAFWAPKQSVRTDYRVKMIGKKPFAPSNFAVKTVSIG